MARSFNGTSDFAYTLNGMTVVDNFTIACWAQYNGGTPAARVVLFGNGKDDNGYFFSVETSGRLGLYYAGVAILDGGVTLTAGRWYHLAAVRGGGTASLYLNGAAQNTAASAPAAPAAKTSFGSVTNASNVGSNFANCVLAECATWSAPLSAQEVLGLALGRRPRRVRPGSLFGYWPLLGAAAETSLDGNAYNLTLTGTAAANHAPVGLLTPAARSSQPSPPAAPAGLTAASAGAGVLLNWGASAGAASYNVYRATASGAEAPYASGVSGAPYLDRAVSVGTTYFYRVTAVGAAGEGSPSNEASALAAAEARPFYGERPVTFTSEP